MIKQNPNKTVELSNCSNKQSKVKHSHSSGESIYKLFIKKMFSAIHLQHRKMITKCNNKLREIMKSCALLAKDWCSLFRERLRTRPTMLKNRKQQFTAETFDSSCSGCFSWLGIIEYLLKQPSSRLQTIKHWPFVKHLTCLQFVVRHTTAQKSSSPKTQSFIKSGPRLGGEK